MNTDAFTEAAAAEARQQWPMRHQQSAFESGARWARRYLTAQEPHVQHLWRPGEPPAAFCGDESARLWESITPEESASVPVCARCYPRAIHEAHDVWAAQEPTKEEIEAVAELIWRRSTGATLWGVLRTAQKDVYRDIARAALSAARAARREETR